MVKASSNAREIDGALRRRADRLDRDVLRPWARETARAVGAYAVSHRMRKAAGPTNEPNRTDRLRIITSRLARSLTGGRFAGQNESVLRMQKAGSLLRVEFGTSVPYAGVHEEGGTFNVRAHVRGGRPVRAHSRTVRARPFLKPSWKMLLPRRMKDLRKRLRQWAKAL